MVFLLGRTGRDKDALNMILDQMNDIDKALPYGLVALYVPCLPSPLQIAVTTPQLAASLTTRAAACAQDPRRRVCRVCLHRRVRQGRPVNVA